MGDKYKERVLKSIYLSLKKYRFKALNISRTLTIWCNEAKKILSPLNKVKIPKITCRDKINNNIFKGLYK